MDFLNSEWSVVDLTQAILSPPKKKTLTDYFQPAAATPKQGLPYSLQRYHPQPTVAEPHNSFEDNAAGPLRESMISGPSNPKHSAVNRTYSLSQKLEVLQYIYTYSEGEAACHFSIPRTTKRR